MNLKYLQLFIYFYPVQQISYQSGKANMQMDNQIEKPQESEVQEINNENVQKNQSVQIKQGTKKRRRKRVDQDGRDYTCSCGKSYLSYPALYTHVKTKHNGELTVPPTEGIQKINNNNISDSKKSMFKSPSSSNLNLEYSLSKPSRNDCQESFTQVQKLKQFMFNQYIKDRSKQALMELKLSAKLKDTQISYINKILKLNKNQQVKEEENQDDMEEAKVINKDLNAQPLKQQSINKNPLSNNKSESLVLENRQRQNKNIHQQTFYLGQSSPEGKIYQQSPFIKNSQSNKILNSSSPTSKNQKKGFSSYINSEHQNLKRSSKDGFSIDQVFGRFLGEVFHNNSYSNQIINIFLMYFVCKIKEYFTFKYTQNCTAEKKVNCLIEQSNQIVSFLTEIQNPYLRQPVSVCKILFSFYRWMFKARFTLKFIKYNEVETFVK